MRIPRRLLALSSIVTLAACGGEMASVATQVGPTAPPVEGPDSESGHPSVPRPTSTLTPMPTEPHSLAIAAAACWFGGIWGDALGESMERKAMDEQRCLAVVRGVWGDNDKGHFEELRALSAPSIEGVVAKVGPETPAGREVRALADAQKEAFEARRAGDKVKRDVAREPDKLTTDEAAAVPAMTSGKALDALLKLDDGDLTHEAHALGVMTAMERLERSRGLPKHLKIYAMEASISSLFGVAAPALPDDATKPLPKGAYLTYVVDAAKGAGHPVPESAKTPRDREQAAWAGVLAGVDDKLKPELDSIPKDTPLADVVARVVHRLDETQKADANAAAKGGAPAKAPAVAPARGTSAPAPAAGTKAPAAIPAAAAKTPPPAASAAPAKK